MADVGLTHIALLCTDPDRTIEFYAKYAAMEVVHRRVDTESGATVVWLSDRKMPFVIVLIQTEKVTTPLLPLAHLGVGCATRVMSTVFVRKREPGNACDRDRPTRVIRSATGRCSPIRTAIPSSFRTVRK
jgi:catechol 2,3-dioxygenase-like lactoylglutathione lyase family enzyme